MDLVPALPILQAAQLPVISDTNTPGASYGDPPSPWFYSDNITPSENTHLYINAAETALHVKSLKGKKFAFVELVSPAVQAAFASLGNVIASDGGSVVSTEQVTLGSTSFSSGAQNVVNSHPNAVFIIDSGGDAIVEAKALGVAGYTAPIFGSQGASDDVTMKSINLPNYYGVRFVNLATPGTYMYKEAVKYGLAASSGGAYFGLGWGVADVIAKTLRKCGYPCAKTSQFERAADSLSTLNVAHNVFYGPSYITAAHRTFITYVQYYGWNSGTNQSVKKFKPVKV
jgi:hypothetical protein